MEKILLSQMEILQNNYMTGISSPDEFKIEFNSYINRPTLSYYEESKLSAEILWSNRIGNVHVFYSGGRDSEFLLNVFLSLKMKVVPVIISTKYNQHDVKYAFDFCSSKNLQPLVINEDYDKLVASDEFNEIFTEMDYGSYYYAPTCKWMPKIDGTVVTGDSNVWVKKGTDNRWYVYEPEAVHEFGNYFAKKKIHGSPYMLCYTPEQYLSFLLDPWIVHLVGDNVPGKMGSESTKENVYNNHTEFVVGPRPKYHGCETVETSDIFNHPNMLRVREKKNNRWLSCYIDYNLFINVLMGQKYTCYSNNICNQ